MRRGSKAGIVFAGAFLAAGAMTLGDVRLASPAPLTLTAPRADRPVPADPWDRIWDRATAVQVPLSMQNVARPTGGRKGMVTARAMNDGQNLSVLLEWKDPTQDLSVATPDSFADQAAIEFPTAKGDRVPFFCMGDPQATVNIWVWKGSRQADVDHGYQDIGNTRPNAEADWYPFEDEQTFYPARAAGNVVASTSGTPVENLVAGSFGTLTKADDQPVSGIGRWKRARWRVMFTRPLAAPADGDVGLAVPETTSVAFAVWDGAAKERNGMKSVAQFLSLDISPQPLGAAPSRVPLLAVIAAFVVGAAVLAAGGTAIARRLSRTGSATGGDVGP